MRRQRLSMGLSLACLLALPLLAAADPDVPFLRPGALALDFDPAEISSLPVDVETLRQGLCTGFPGTGGRPPILPAAECEMAVRSPPSLGLFTDGAPVPGAVRVTLRPQEMRPWEGSAPVDTPCGLWDVSMRLDPSRQQPVSELALEPFAEDSSQGVFAGVVQLAVLFHVVHRDRGFSLDLPAIVPLNLAGRWTAVPETATGTWIGDDEASNLALFAGSAGGTWLSIPGYASWAGAVRPCRVYPVPAGLVEEFPEP